MPPAFDPLGDQRSGEIIMLGVGGTFYLAGAVMLLGRELPVTGSVQP